MHLDLPRPREERARVLHVHRQARAAGVLVHEEHAVPVLAAVGCAEHTALLLSAGNPAGRAREHDVGIRGVHQNAADAAGLVEPHVGPRAAGVDRFVDAIADDVAVADGPRFTGAGPDDAGVGRGDGKRADGCDRHAVGHGGPTDAAVGRLPHAAGRGAGVIRRRVARHAGNRRDAVADDRPEEAKGEAVRLRGAAPLRVERERQNTGQYQAEQKARRFHLRIVGPHRNSSVRLQADVRKKQDDPRGPAKGIPARIAFDSEYKG